VTTHANVVIVGGGPAGLAAARAATAAGAKVTLIDERTQPGGNVWAGAENMAAKAELAPALATANLQVITGQRVIAAHTNADGGALLLESNTTSTTVTFKRLVIASGARELMLPFPGNTLIGVTGAGGLQLLVKQGLNVRQRRVVIAGSGPLLLAAAQTLLAAGGHVVCVAEQAPLKRVAAFAVKLLWYPDRMMQSLDFARQLPRIHYVTGTRIANAAGDTRLRRITLQRNDGATTTLDCDYLAVSHGIVANTELAAMLGCEMDQSGESPRVIVDEQQRTSIGNIFAAGEVTGCGGKVKAMAEGALAGRVSANAAIERAVQRRVARERRYAELLAKSFAPRLSESPTPDANSIVCRCEDVRWQTVAPLQSWREARLQARCGMGHCQGRYCGASLRLLKQFSPSDGREPLLPCRIETLMDEKFS
jgi:thioredoxin reductase